MFTFFCLTFCRFLIIFLTILSTLRIKSRLGWKFGSKTDMTGKMGLPFTSNCLIICRTCANLFANFILHVYRNNLFSVCVHAFLNSPELSELYKPLEDPLIESCMEILNLTKDGKPRGSMTASFAKNALAKVFPRPRKCWLPTGCLVRYLFKKYSESYHL